ncbi:MAG: hypothetical protein EA426_00145 [Spirochaetaceae bacterium]|nr:MAG: hypothetical protein EA426_00145 [Spirochaetaceae bacterium]
MEIGAILFGLLVSVVCAVRPFRIGRLSIDMATGPVIVALVLFAAGIVTPATILSGILGAGNVRPWEIMVVFFTVAYMSASTDVSGVFDAIAFSVARRARGNGTALFWYFYLVASVFTVFTSNDIVILTLTPIIVYVGRHARVNVVPILFVQFFGANIASMLLYIGNPTNIVVATALTVSFPAFTAVTWPVTVVAIVVNGLLVYWVFRRDITRRYDGRSDSKIDIRNPVDAAISVFLMALLLAALSVAHLFAIPVWLVTTALVIVFHIEDAAFTLHYRRRAKKRTRDEPHRQREFFAATSDIALAYARMPWKILPFIVVCFSLVHALAERGVTTAIARLYAQIAVTPTSAVFAAGSFGFLAANVMNNQPMTILLAKALVDPIASTAPAGIMPGAFALVVASNLAANLTLIGALAGVMWKRILDGKGVSVSYGAFLRTGAKVTLVVALVSFGVLSFVFSR